jgi:serine/threonine protein kinase
MGVVYKAKHKYRNEIFALKSLSPQLVSDNKFRQRFRNEAEALHKLSHPNIVRVLDFLEEPDGLHLVMEYIDGITLYSIIENNLNGLALDRALQMFKNISEGVNYAHNNGVIHRDLKPSNILVTKKDEVKITDFGIAKILGQTALTATGTRMGTLYYMSPEQIKGEIIDVQAEVYSLGVILYQMLTGHLPYSVTLDTSEFEVMKKITEDEPINPKKYKPDLPEWIIAVIKKAIEKEKSNRYHNVSALIESLKFDRTEIELHSEKKDSTIISDLVETESLEKTVLDKQTKLSDRKDSSTLNDKKRTMNEQNRIAPKRNKFSVKRIILITIALLTVITVIFIIYDLSRPAVYSLPAISVSEEMEDYKIREYKEAFNSSITTAFLEIDAGKDSILVKDTTYQLLDMKTKGIMDNYKLERSDSDSSSRIQLIRGKDNLRRFYAGNKIYISLNSNPVWSVVFDVGAA